jgi:ABC-type transporter Mla MlaB component
MTAATTCEPAELHPDSPDRISLKGALTVRNIGHVRSRIAAAMRSHDVLRLDCSGATDVDLSFLQLVLAARKSAAAAGKTLTLAHPAGGVLLERLNQAGLLTGIDGHPADEAEFWLNPETADGEDHPHGR